MLYVIILIALVVVAVGVIAALKSAGLLPPASAGRDDHLPYQRRAYFFSKAEHSFFRVLQQAGAPRWAIFAKVRLIDLIEVKRGTDKAQSHRNRIQSKHVDFVLCTPDRLQPVLVIELDDKSHASAGRAARDNFVDAALAAAGLPILHIPAKSAYNVSDLAEQLSAKALPSVASGD